MASPSQRLNILVAAVTLISVFAMASQLPLDPDMWWHLRAGDEIWHNRHVLTQDVFSYTRLGTDWVNVFWVSDLVMYIVFRYGSYLALAALVALVAALSMAVVYKHMNAPPFLCAFLIILAAATAAPTWTVRPQLVSFLLLAVLDLWLTSYRLGRFRRLWWLPLLFVLWANLHGGFIWGWLLILAVIVGEICNHLLAFPVEQCMSWPKIRLLGLWSLTTIPAVLLNPSGLRAWWLPFQQVSVSLVYIQEWFSPDFHRLAFHPLIWMVLGLLAAVGMSGILMSVADFLKVAGFAYLAFYAQRNLGPFAVIAVPVLARYLMIAIEAWAVRAAPTLEKIRGRFSKAKTSRPLDRRVTIFLNSLIILLLSVVALLRLWIVASSDVVEAKLVVSYPQQAVQWIKSELPQKKLFNAYNWGGYLTWQLREYPVFIDGRADLYGEEIISQWFTISGAESGWEDLLDRWDVNLILLEPWQPVVAKLPEKGWKLLYQDDLAVVYGR